MTTSTFVATHVRVETTKGFAEVTCLEYDTPSSLFGQFNDDRIASVAGLLDRKLEELMAAAVG